MSGSTSMTGGPAAEPECGDGTIDPDEQCDDGNVQSGDDCSSACTWEVASVYAGGTHSCALTAGGGLKCWGNNDQGQLGLGDMLDRGDEPDEMGHALPFVDLGEDVTIVQVGLGASHTCALLSDNTIKCWGSAAQGQLGLGDTELRGDQEDEKPFNLPTVDFGSGTVLQLEVDSSRSCVLLEGGTVKCWGVREHTPGPEAMFIGDEPGEMGEALEHVLLPSPALVVDTGGLHTCALMPGSLQCWGQNTSAQLGVGNTTDYGLDYASVPPADIGDQAVEVSTALTHTCARTAQGIKCWGSNEYGVLGQSIDADILGDSPEQMGSALPYVALGSDFEPVHIDASPSFNCALAVDGRIKCWGRNDRGQLGLGDNQARGSTAGDMGDGLPPVELGMSALAVATGGSHTCALLEDRSVKCWGTNSSGQLGLGDRDNRGDEPGEMGEQLAAIDLGL